MDKVTGYVTGVNGNLVAATFSGSVRKNEVGYVLVGDDRLKGEVIRVNGDTASMQIYEMTNGIQVGDKVELSGELMSVELGPGLLTQVFDGLQNPLPELAQQCGFFLQRGVYLDPIPNKDWEFTPLVKPGDHVTAGDAVGSVDNVVARLIGESHLRDVGPPAGAGRRLGALGVGERHDRELRLREDHSQGDVDVDNIND